jgi:hypothetical protein
MAQLKDQSPDNAQLHKDLAAFDAEIAKLEQAGAVKPEAAQPEQAAR